MSSCLTLHGRDLRALTHVNRAAEQAGGFIAVISLWNSCHYTEATAQGCYRAIPGSRAINCQGIYLVPTVCVPVLTEWPTAQAPTIIPVFHARSQG